jgi:hypothetical protein
MAKKQIAAQRKFKISNLKNRTVMVGIITLIVGFVIGVCYTHVMNTSATTPTTVPSPTHLCNCPMMRVNQNPSDYCHC